MDGWEERGYAGQCCGEGTFEVSMDEWGLKRRGQWNNKSEKEREKQRSIWPWNYLQWNTVTVTVTVREGGGWWEPSVEIRPGSIGQMKYGYGYKLAGWWCECDEEHTKVVETRD